MFVLSLCTCAYGQIVFLKAYYNIPTSYIEWVEIFQRGDGERGVKARRKFSAGEFVLEFEGNLLTKGEYQLAEIEYCAEQLPIYTLEVILHM